MSIYYRDNGGPEVRVYGQQEGETPEHGRTKQSYKESCDINRILEKHATIEQMSHLEKHGARYGDFAGFDFQEHHLQMAEGQQIFDELPAETKREFQQDPTEFFNYVNDPKNRDRLPELLPKIVQHGNFFPAMGQATQMAPQTVETVKPIDQADTQPEKTAEKPVEAPLDQNGGTGDSA